MNWKKTTVYFIWQSVRRAESWQQFVQFWSYRKPWLASFQKGRNSIADELPWLPFHAQAFLKDQLQPSFKVFEFGGGGSTLFFCKHAGEVVTVEDHEEWFSTLTQMVKTKNYPNWVG
ncbi:MAG TPA: hypothetical protein PKC51_08750, partial [Ferruginibacter sp.]|nr:hypothetical protein [Ferruginibacter sp.]